MTSNIEKLKNKSRKITGIEQASGLLNWDQEVMMPEKGIKARSQQLSVLKGLKHEIVTSDELADLIDQIDPESLDKEDKAVYREVKREHLRAKTVDQDLLEKISSKSSETVDKWKEARKEKDFSIVKENLEDLVELKRRYAKQIDSEREPYEVLFEDYEPYLGLETMESFLEEIKEEITEILEKINKTNSRLEFDTIDDDKQLEINRDILSDLGYEWDRGRLDISEHPFTSGNQFDVRITTRTKEDDPTQTILPTIHEFGHALYQMNLPEEKYGLPTGQSREIGFHESQSTIWENHIGRSKSFAEYLNESYETFSGVEVGDIFRHINRLKPDNLVRVEADELTYHLHIYLRFKLERQLVNGDIEVEQLQEKWRTLMEDLLGNNVKSPNEGLLQDIHWYLGNFGYFPTYSLGCILSAQIYRAMDEDIEDLEKKIEEGDFSQIRGWLEQNVHQYGKIYRTEELIEKATGEKPGADSFLNYIRDKYGEIFNI